MVRFNKLLNTRIIAIIVAVCLLSILVYCPPAHSHAYSLRVPMDDDYDRLNESNSIQAVKDEDVPEQGDNSAPNNNMSRREFLKSSAKYVALGLIMTALPILLTGNPEKMIKAIENLDKYTLSFDYLHSLTKKEGSAYIQGIYYAVNANKVERNQAETFLRKIFNNESLLWMREESVKVLIKLDMLTKAELDELIYSTPDRSVLSSIASALGEAGTKEAVKRLIAWSKTEEGWRVRESIAFALGRAGTKEAVERLIAWSKTGGIFRGSIAYSLGEAGTKEAVERLIAWSKTEKDQGIMASIAYSLGEAGTKEAVEYLIAWSKAEKDQGVMVSIALALGGAGTKEAVERLIAWSKTEEGQGVMVVSIASGLGRAGTKEAVEYLIAWSKTRGIRGSIALALAQAGTKEAVERLIAWSKAEEDQGVRESIALALAQAGTKEAVERLIAWSKTEEGQGIMVSIVSGLGRAGTKEAVEYLIACSKTEEGQGIMVSIVSGLGRAGTKEAVEYLIACSKTGGIRRSIAYALGEAGTKEAVERLIAWSKTEEEARVMEALAYALGEAVGYKTIELFWKEIKSSSGIEKETIQSMLTYAIAKIIDSALESFNFYVDDNVQLGEEIIRLYFKRLQDNPEILYPIVASSHEITSHSFPVAYEYLREHIKSKYGTFDIFRYVSEEWDGMFLPEFLFTLTIFNKLEESFADTQYSPGKLAELILSDNRIQSLLTKPALFSKVISSITNFKDVSLKEAFIDRILKLGKKNFELKVLISLMLEFKLIPKEDRLRSLIIDLPEYNPAWHSPQKDWLKDNVLSVGLYWSTAKEGEKAHYEQFPKIFTNGSKVNSFYSNFGGYVDKSKDPDYKDKLIKNGAEKILVKEFPGTNRKIEIYLYSSLDAIKASPHSITISRGHAGEEGNDDYPGLPGTLRFASHCRSIDDSDELIKANPDSPTITITGTGRAVETNPTLYYLLEYLGGEETWGNWRTIKEYIKPHIPKSIRKYNFPTDDMSFIYAAILQNQKPQETQKSSSSNMQMGIIGALKALESLGSKL